ncbi:hypothetical protein EZS27_002892 [termite gut metagenome]|jgi:hypothetical protein|uniref:Uncharacterized protein n=1 Tax=termite gut metagenome TaxID=433724 RepID=A0A5J4SVB4_9ZZZZ
MNSIDEYIAQFPDEIQTVEEVNVILKLSQDDTNRQFSQIEDR